MFKIHWNCNFVGLLHHHFWLYIALALLGIILQLCKLLCLAKDRWRGFSTHKSHMVNRGVTIYLYIDISQYTRNLYRIAIRNVYRNISRLFPFLFKLFLFSFISYLIATVSPEIACLWHLYLYQRSLNRHMRMYIILILLRKVQTKGKYWEINWISIKILWKQHIAIYCDTVPKYRNISQYVFSVSWHP